MPVLLLALALATPPEQAAHKHFERAEKLYALGKFQDALVEYEAAYEAKALPGFLFNIGQCYRNLGNYKQAVFSFRKYLDEKPDAKNRDAVEGLIAELEKKNAEEDRHPPDLAAHRDPSPTPPREVAIAKAEEPAAEPERPLYAKWWFWTIVGAAAVGAGVAIYAATSSGDSGIPDTTFHNIDFPR